MSLSQTNILGIKITTNQKADLLAFIVNYLKSQKASKGLKIYTPNPEQIVFAHKHPEFREVLNSADINLPDGIGTVWAVNQLTAHSHELSAFTRIPGIEFMEELVKVAAEKKWPVTFIGGRYGVAEQALDNLKQKYPGLEGWAEDGPEVTISNFKFQISNNTNEENYFYRLVQKINNSGVMLVFVGLGAPKQEYFISRLARECQMSNVKCRMVFMSVGGAFDIISGKLPRAPSFMRDLEFLWRLIHEPWRIKRHFALLWFIILVLVRKSGSHSNS